MPQGEFSFETIKPGPVPGPGNSLQAPHLNLIVFSRGMLTHAFTRVYFDDESSANENDPILSLVEPARRGTLIAKREAAADGNDLQVRHSFAGQVRDRISSIRNWRAVIRLSGKYRIRARSIRNASAAILGSTRRRLRARSIRARAKAENRALTNCPGNW
jgi:hypothetical protein